MLKITLLGADPAVETEMRIRFSKLYCQQLDTLTPDDVSAHADASQCDVVLTVVPHVSRIVRETLSALRARKFTTPIVGLLSAHTRTWDADRASFLNAGGDDLLALPCNLDNLEATCQRCWSKYFYRYAVSNSIRRRFDR
jgi:DNA-binding response OmpR family regulator